MLNLKKNHLTYLVCTWEYWVLCVCVVCPMSSHFQLISFHPVREILSAFFRYTHFITPFPIPLRSAPPPHDLSTSPWSLSCDWWLPNRKWQLVCQSIIVWSLTFLNWPPLSSLVTPTLLETNSSLWPSFHLLVPETPTFLYSLGLLCILESSSPSAECSKIHGIVSETLLNPLLFQWFLTDLIYFLHSPVSFMHPAACMFCGVLNSHPKNASQCLSLLFNVMK